MDEQALLCETVCRSSPGWLIELLVLLLLGGRALYSSLKARRAAAENVELKAQVKTLSMRPPPPMQIQLAPNPALASLLPIALTTAPADSTSVAKSAVSSGQATHPGPEPSDPDYLEPPEDGS
jgi:hypothetical protein